MGEFTYTYLHPKKYPLGIELMKQSGEDHFLIASPEKALCDLIYLNDKKIVFNHDDEIEAYLFEDLRIDESRLRILRLNLLSKLSHLYGDQRLKQLTQFIKNWKR